MTATIEVEDPQDRWFEELDVIANISSTYPALPTAMLERPSSTWYKVGVCGRTCAFSTAGERKSFQRQISVPTLKNFATKNAPIRSRSSLAPIKCTKQRYARVRAMQMGLTDEA